MSVTVKAILLGLLIGIMGLAVSPLHFMLSLEENIGMGLLFKLRGARQAPSDAVVVSIDKESSEKLNLPDNPDKWPRSLHARLTETLAAKGAEVIAFDVHFIEPRSTKDDSLFAEALKKAGDVVLCEPLKLHEVPLSGGQEYDDTASHNIVKLVQPIDLFTHAACAIAPFTLPRIPFKVSQYWTFETGAGDSPTMPAVALQLYTAQVYGDFIQLLQKVNPQQAEQLPGDIETATRTIGIRNLMKRTRAIFEREPSIEEKMLKELDSSKTQPGLKERRLIRALIRMYGGGNSRYIDFYGPPGTVATVPYYQALETGERSAGDKHIDFAGKAVFVGLSEVLLAERKDSFYTVFSRANGTFIGGVEIMATAFLNLLADTPMKPLSTSSYIFLILFWGVLIGAICRLAPVGYAAVGTVGLCVLYLAAAEYQFKNSYTWYPVVIPLFFQAPIAFIGALAWTYADAKKELKNVKDAFGHYLPEDVVNKLARDVANIQTDSKVIDGICLMTDAQEYTSLSENMDPHELRGFMNRYYETMFKPVKQHGGFVSGVTGDAMLALWVAARPDADLKNNACCAALDINQAMRAFRQKASDSVKIKTRIGVHCGRIILGNIGALDHYQYTPMGDIVNTASRIEGLNKYLNTSLLVSEEVVGKLDGFLLRDVGKFRLKGKVKPIAAYELIARKDKADEKESSACAIFAGALSAFKRQSWDEAKAKFDEVVEILGQDGPSAFYIGLCERYNEYPPAEPWDGVVTMGSK